LGKFRPNKFLLREVFLNTADKPGRFVYTFIEDCKTEKSKSCVEIFFRFLIGYI